MNQKTGTAFIAQIRSMASNDGMNVTYPILFIIYSFSEPMLPSVLWHVHPFVLLLPRIPRAHAKLISWESLSSRQSQSLVNIAFAHCPQEYLYS